MAVVWQYKILLLLLKNIDYYQVFKSTQWKSSFLGVSKLVSENLFPFSEDTDI